jgi:two-component system sensor histidine kinase and response regulator WspE
MSMRELLRMEVETQSRVLIDNLLALEHGALTDKHLEAMMRAAHSMKGGARIADLLPAVELAHVMEDLFVAVRAGQVEIQSNGVNLLLKAVDVLTELAQAGAGQDNLPDDLVQRAAAMRESVLAIAQSPHSPPPPLDEPKVEPAKAAAESVSGEHNLPGIAEQKENKEAAQASSARTVRVSVESMNRLMALVGELSVKGKAAAGIRTEAFLARRRMREAQAKLDGLKRHLVDLDAGEHWLSELDESAGKIGNIDEFLTRVAGVLETHDAHTTEIIRQMQREVIAHRMQPFGDVALGFRRLARQLGQTLGKEVTLTISGAEVGVDSDILERLNAPLTHLIQNAVDHGIGSPEERVAANKPTSGSIRLSAQHRGGLLSIVVEDDGDGIDLEQVRQAVLDKRLVSETVASSLQENELLEFLFLPNFTMSRQLSDISGRGVGLDLVRHTLREVRGSIRVSTRVGKGTRFEITLPVTLIVVHCLVIEIAGELFALPVGRIARVLQAERDVVQSLENRQYLMLDGYQTGLIIAAELLELSGGKPQQGELAIVVLAKDQRRYSLVVDRLVGERQLVERPLDARLGKVEDVASMSMLDDGSPVLILDVDDLLHSIEQLAGERVLRKVRAGEESAQAAQGKRVLVVDDSITVREVERSLLSLHGYVVDVAMDGAEGWNALRTGKYDLVVTDVDMPRMNGIELVKLIRADARLRDLPVIIVSYKDRDEDRLNGMDAGADRYLTKGTFQDDTFIHTVSDLIGVALS